MEEVARLGSLELKRPFGPSKRNRTAAASLTLMVAVLFHANALVEASVCGVPLVATRVGGVPDVLIEGRTGLGVDAGDVPGAAAALSSLLTDAARRREYGTAARNEVVARFSETAAIDRLLALYARVSA